MSRSTSDLYAAAQRGTNALIAYLAQLADTWLTTTAHSMPLADLLDRRQDHWPGDNGLRDGRTILFPLVHHGPARVTARLFCELTDAACEAVRDGAQVVVVGIPLGRAGRDRRSSSQVAEQIAAAWRGVELPVVSAGSVDDLPGMTGHLLNAGRRAGFTLRSRDLSDMFIAAVADALNIHRIYVAQGVGVGRCLSGHQLVASLGRLYAPTPFQDPPPAAKRRPAGSDALWELAFTTELIDTVSMPSARARVRRVVQERLARAWNVLRKAGLTAHRTPTATRDRVLRFATRPDQSVPAGPVVLPLFGSPLVSAVTQSLIDYTAASTAGRPLSVVIDDINPSFLYREYNRGAVRARWHAAVGHLAGNVLFLSGLDVEDLGHRLVLALSELTTQDLRVVLSPGRWGRCRGTATGYDAVHLAMMAVATRLLGPATVAVRSANFTAVQRIIRGHPDFTALVAAGFDGIQATDASPALIQPVTLSADGAQL